METEINDILTNNSQPQVFLKKIMFNDDTELALSNNSIVVFTGANNCGKSQVLKDIESSFNPSNNAARIIVINTEVEYCGTIEGSNFLKNRFFINHQMNLQPYECQDAFDRETLYHYWRNHTLYNGLYRLFVKRLDTASRITLSNDLVRHQNPERHPIYKLNNSETLAKTISNFFHKAFGVDLIVNRNDVKTIPLHIGKAPNSQEYTMDRQDEYYKIVSSLPKLKDQGDGMRSFASILLDAFTSDYSITLVDEPEAFLHPPQARVLGNMLARNISNRQLFISTHSEDFLQGLLDANNDNVTVIHINRHQDENKISVLLNDSIKTLWSNPLLRYSDILSGLFHEKVVECESDYDCLFYQSVMFAMFENADKITPDILFTHCGGKSRAKDVVKALSAVNVPVVAICDFDLINASQNFKPLAAAFSIDWDKDLSRDMKTIYDTVNAKPKEWERLKKLGKKGLDGDAPAAYDKVSSIRSCPLTKVEHCDKYALTSPS